MSPFFNLFALRIHGAASREASAAHSKNSCDLYFWNAACHVFNASTPLWCSCFPFLYLFFFTSSDICSWSNGRPHQSNILDLGNRLSVRVSRWIPSKWWKFHTSWSMLRRAYLGGLVARAYFERCQVSTSGKYDMGMIHSQVIRYLRVSALTAKK